MTITRVTHHKNQPISYDQIEIEDIDGNKYYLLDSEIEELLQQKGNIEESLDE